MLSFSEAEFKINNREIMPERPPTLTPMLEALEDCDLFPVIDPERVIVVAGTNGKGTTAKALETLLRASGKTTGLYTSPHLVSICERIQINGELISQEKPNVGAGLIEAFAYVGGSVLITLCL